jgi:long-subunit acyl-CoA synthetase (AMP-forming)
MAGTTASTGKDETLAAALSAQTLCEAFQITAAARTDQVALRTPDDSVSITYGDMAARVRGLAAGLAGLGLRRGDPLGIMLVNRPEFHLVDCAAIHLGASPFSVYNTSAPEQIAYLFGDAGNRIVVTERQFVDRIVASGTPLDHIVVVDGAVDDALSLEDVEAAAASDFDFDAAWRAVQPEDVLTLIYTSGTTGPPKGVELTHAGLMAEIRAVQEAFPTTPGGRAVSFLPSAHIADRWYAHYSGLMVWGFTITSVADPTQLMFVVGQVHPTVFGSVPRIWEKVKAGLEAQGVTDPASLPDEAKAAVRAKLGLDQSEWFVVGAAPTPVEVLEYYLALGIPVCELWGMSELSCVATVNPPDRIKIGTVGPPLPGVEVKLADDGELLCRGPIVMKGYRNKPEMTAETIDADGWLHTGDVATIDDDGYVKIVDRKKELIINAAGKNMSPANIEAALKSSGPLIGQACVIGDRRPYNVALLVLDPDAAAGLDPTDEDVQARVRDEVEAANAKLSRVEQIKRFELLDEEWLPGGDELTPTMKLKRKPIAAKYEAEIEALYA